MKKKLFVLFLLLATCAPSAQTQFDLKQFFEGRKVSVDMPTKDGLDIYPEQLPATDLIVYSNRKSASASRCAKVSAS